MSDIRPANKADIDWILAELRLFADAIPDEIVKFPSNRYAVDFISFLIANHVILVDESNKAVIAGLVNQNPLNPEKVLLSEIFWWVNPEHRQSKAGLRLLKAFLQQARDMECVDYVTVSLESESKVGDNTLMRLGLMPRERTFLMEV